MTPQIFTIANNSIEQYNTSYYLTKKWNIENEAEQS